MARYFGTDGLRGVYGETLTLSMAYHIGRALKLVFQVEEAVVASDTRVSKDPLKQALAQGARSVGVTLYDAGILPTPAVALYAQATHSVAIMITASHNPYTDNGLKIFDRGRKLNETTETAIEALFDDPMPEASVISLPETTAVSEFYSAKFNDFGRAELSVTLDCANGALYALAPKLLAPKVNTLHLIHHQPDGQNINRACGSTHLESLLKTVQANQDAVGFAFDGDGDRVLAVDAHGRIYTGDHLIYILANHYHRMGQLPGRKVALTVMSNPGILASYRNEGIAVTQTPVGDKYISAALQNEGLALGGEASGHIIDAHYATTGDGLYIAFKILEIMQQTQQSLADLTAQLMFYPERLTNHKGLEAQRLERASFQTLLKQHQEAFKDDGTILVRKSGTEALIRLYVSHRDEARMQAVHQELLEALTE